MKRKIILFILCIISCIPVLGNTILVNNPGNNLDISTNLKFALSLAQDKDSVLLPKGFFTFTGTVIVSKQISLIGTGIDNTILYRSETIADSFLDGIGFFKFDINNNSPSGIIISDFTLRSKKPSEVDMDGNLIQSGSKAIDYGIILNFAVDFVITRVRFENFGYAGLCITHRDDLARGVVFNCEFNHNYKYDGLGLGYGISVYGENLSWVISPKFGSDNFIFIENNIFEKNRHAICGGGNSLYVARYNTFKNHYLDATIDMHEARGNDSNTYSSRATEVYNNSLSNDFYIDNVPVCDCTPWHIAGTSTGGNALSSLAIGIRGGETLIYNNNIAYYRSGICFYAIYHSQTGDKDVYPLTSQIGYASGVIYGISDSGIDSSHGNGDAYIWDNTFKFYGPSDKPYNDLFINYAEVLLKENRDFHFVAKPAYQRYTYPHPLRSKVNANILVSSITIFALNGGNVITSNRGTLPLEAVITPSGSSIKKISWNIAFGAEFCNISSDGVVTAMANGAVTVKATSMDGSGVFATFSIVISNQITIITDNEANVLDKQLIVYPNPCIDSINIELKNSSTNNTIIFTIYDIKARILFKKFMQFNPNGNFVLDLSFLNTGIYIMKIQTESAIYTQRIIVE